MEQNKGQILQSVMIIAGNLSSRLREISNE